MIVGIVAGEVFGTHKHPFYNGKKMLIVDKLDFSGSLTGDSMVAVDSVGAGLGETVLILDEGTGARQIVQDSLAPIRSIIVGVIDHMDLETQCK